MRTTLNLVKILGKSKTKGGSRSGFWEGALDFWLVAVFWKNKFKGCCCLVAGGGDWMREGNKNGSGNV